MLQLVAFASLASVALAAGSQTAPYGGYGRFPCNAAAGGADQSLCASATLTAFNPVKSPNSQLLEQGQNPVPVDSVCVEQGSTGAFFCGIEGAACSSDAACDNGSCNPTTKKCQGSFATQCDGDDSNCLGLLYCTSYNVDPLTTCGQNGAYCGDFSLYNPDLSDPQQNVIYNEYCASSYCQSLQVTNSDGSANTVSQCAAPGGVGAVCQPDNVGSCTTGLRCDSLTLECTAAPEPTGMRARARRSMKSARSLCPASHSACVVTGVKSGFECIDTTSNLEQCGACAQDGGVDCTTLEGVDAVGCVAGQCEIWSCAEGYSWDATSSACVA